MGFDDENKSPCNLLVYDYWERSYINMYALVVEFDMIMIDINRWWCMEDDIQNHCLLVWVVLYILVRFQIHSRPEFGRCRMLGIQIHSRAEFAGGGGHPCTVVVVVGGHHCTAVVVVRIQIHSLQLQRS